MTEAATLALRLAGPLQSWGTTSEYNVRATEDRPSKAGVVGLLAAAQGRRRGEDLLDLVDLQLAVRVDQPGTRLVDYHTASDLRGRPLLSSNTNKKGLQQPTGPRKFTHVTRRHYLQDAVFLVLLHGQVALLDALAAAIRSPRYPLFLGRRSCPPAQPVLVPSGADLLWTGRIEIVVREVPWQAGLVERKRRDIGSEVTVSASIDIVDDATLAGDVAAGSVSELLNDVPTSFAPSRRAYAARRVSHQWVTLLTGKEQTDDRTHDPFALLGW